MDSSRRIGIMGVGMVGGALKRYFEKEGLKPFLFDTNKKIGSLEQVNQADIIFICVPTPFDKQRQSFDCSFAEQALASIQDSKIVVLKSTVLPGTTERLQNHYPKHKLLFNPEFLTEAKADQDMRHPDRQLLGYTEKSQGIAGEVMRLLPKAPLEKIMPAIEAEMAKYFANTFLATKVIFAEQMAKLCEKLGIDYNNVMEAAAADKRIGASHLKAAHNNYHGYGGHCLVKDMKSLIQFAKDQGISLELHQKVDRLNDDLMEKQGIEDPEEL